MMVSDLKITHFLLILSLLVLVSCSKHKKHFAAKAYHNTTSLFNGYYNATELYRETVKRIEDQYQIPENDFVNIVYYGTEDEIRSYVNDLEKIIKKNDLVIYKHPNGNYVDNCRLLTGKAYFYKQNYTLGMQNFEEVIKHFPNSKLLADAYLWQAKSFYALDNTQLALEIIEERMVETDTLPFSKDLKGEIAIFKSQMDIDNEDYASAAFNLEAGVEFIGGRMRKARAHYLLGQLYGETENYAKALENFDKVQKFSSDYGLVFKAKIKVARLYVNFQSGQDDEEQVYKYLKKLLKDEKNLEFHDQIYYEFALLELKKDSLDNALDYLRQSIDANINNSRQKALSYYKSGQIYFYDYQNYDKAQAYFDSAATVITPNSPEYKEITDIGKTLKAYVEYKHTITYQDSMLSLAELSEEELSTLIDSIAAEEARKKKEEEEKRLEEMLANQNKPGNNWLYQQQLQNQRTNNRGSSGWYFDNPSTISNGRLEFEQLWGKRNNEDNWRRSKRSGLSTLNTEDVAATDDSTVVDSSMIEQYGDNAKYYKDIPKNEEEVLAANIKIEEALYYLGELYFNKLNEPDSAIKTFEILLDRYEESDFVLRTRYALYQLYKAKDDPIFNVHKSIILNEYPNTVYAYLILGKDPNELKKAEEDFQYAYTGLFNSYYNEEYQTSIGFSRFLLETHKENPELRMDQLQYIMGMSYGYTGEIDSLIKILTHVINTYPESEVTPPAKKTLDIVGELATASNTEKPLTPTRKAPSKGEDKKPGEEGAGEEKSLEDLTNENNPKYKSFTTEVKPNDRIFVLMFVDKNNISKNDATIKISRFNKAAFPDMQLKVFTFMYKDTHLLPYISKFDTYQDALTFIEKLKNDDAGKQLLLGDEDTIFFITHTNFKIAYGQKRIADYIDFYDNILLPGMN